MKPEPLTYSWLQVLFESDPWVVQALYPDPPPPPPKPEVEGPKPRFEGEIPEGNCKWCGGEKPTRRGHCCSEECTRNYWNIVYPEILRRERLEGE